MSLKETLFRARSTPLQPFFRTGGPQLVLIALFLAGAIVAFPYDMAVAAGPYPATLGEWQIEGAPALFACSLVFVALLTLAPGLALAYPTDAERPRYAAAAASTIAAGAVVLVVALAPFVSLSLRDAGGSDAALASRLAGAFETITDLAPFGLAIFWMGTAMLAEVMLPQAGRHRLVAGSLGFLAGLAALGPFIVAVAPTWGLAAMLGGCLALAALGVHRTTQTGRPAGEVPQSPEA